MKVGSRGLLLSSVALRQTKGVLQPSTERLEAAPLSFQSGLQQTELVATLARQKIKQEVCVMATKASAKEKYVSSVTSPLAVDKMTDKLSTYLGISVTEASAPVKNWKEFTKEADDYFELLYKNMQAAYR